VSKTVRLGDGELRSFSIANAITAAILDVEANATDMGVSLNWGRAEIETEVEDIYTFTQQVYSMLVRVSVPGYRND